jgi:hypothetical protein
VPLELLFELFFSATVHSAKNATVPTNKAISPRETFAITAVVGRARRSHEWTVARRTLRILKLPSGAPIIDA